MPNPSDIGRVDPAPALVLHGLAVLGTHGTEVGLALIGCSGILPAFWELSAFVTL